MASELCGNLRFRLFLLLPLLVLLLLQKASEVVRALEFLVFPFAIRNIHKILKNFITEMSLRFIAIWYSLTGIEANRLSKGTAAAAGHRDKKANRGGVGAREEGEEGERE